MILTGLVNNVLRNDIDFNPFLLPLSAKNKVNYKKDMDILPIV